MKRVAIYEPSTKIVVEGKNKRKVIDDKKAKLINTRSVMNRTLAEFKNTEDLEGLIFQRGFYMEEVFDEKDLSEKSRAELDNIAANAGVEAPESIKNKEGVIDAIKSFFTQNN